MKKVLFGSLVALFAVSIVLTSCDEDNPLSCTEKLAEVSSAALEFNSNPTQANCEDYKDALEDYLKCDGIVNKDYYQATLDGLDCSSL